MARKRSTTRQRYVLLNPQLVTMNIKPFVRQFLLSFVFPLCAFTFSFSRTANNKTALAARKHNESHEKFCAHTRDDIEWKIYDNLSGTICLVIANRKK